MFKKLFKPPVNEKKLSGARDTIRESLQAAKQNLTEILKELDPPSLSLVPESNSRKKVNHD